MKSLRSYSIVLISSLILILSPPGSWKYVLLSLYPQSRILSTCLLSSGHFHPLFKQSVVSPLLRKSTLDNEQLSNYRPISNLSLISKIIERVVKSWLTDHLYSHSLLNPHQSAYRRHHSTEISYTSTTTSSLLLVPKNFLVSLSTWSFCCLWHHRPWHFTHLALILVWHSRLCSQLV